MHNRISGICLFARSWVVWLKPLRPFFFFPATAPGVGGGVRAGKVSIFHRYKVAGKVRFHRYKVKWPQGVKRPSLEAPATPPAAPDAQGRGRSKAPESRPSRAGCQRCPLPQRGRESRARSPFPPTPFWGLGEPVQKLQKVIKERGKGVAVRAPQSLRGKVRSSPPGSRPPGASARRA